MLKFTRAPEDLLAFCRTLSEGKGDGCTQCIFVSSVTEKSLCALTKTTAISMTHLIFLGEEAFAAVQRETCLFAGR